MGIIEFIIMSVRLSGILCKWRLWSACSKWLGLNVCLCAKWSFMTHSLTEPWAAETLTELLLWRCRSLYCISVIYSLIISLETLLYVREVLHLYSTCLAEYDRYEVNIFWYDCSWFRLFVRKCCLPTDACQSILNIIHLLI